MYRRAIIFDQQQNTGQNTSIIPLSFPLSLPPSLPPPQIVYFTATFPYVILVCLFFRAVTLDGAGDGLRFLFLPDSSFRVRDGVPLLLVAQVVKGNVSLHKKQDVSTSAAGLHNTSFFNIFQRKKFSRPLNVVVKVTKLIPCLYASQPLK